MKQTIFECTTSLCLASAILAVFVGTTVIALV